MGIAWDLIYLFDLDTKSLTLAPGPFAMNCWMRVSLLTALIVTSKTLMALMRA